MRILIVEDEKDLCELLKKRLKKEYTIDVCMDGESALDYIDIYQYDLILLDIMLPKMDGITVLKRIRNQRNTTPVLLLTAKGSISDRVDGLDAGADDYLVKPFAFEELQARIRVLLRRNASANPSDILQVADLIMNTKTKIVTRGGEEIALTTKEYKLLQYMMRNPNAVLTRDQLEQRAWDSSFEGGSNIVDVYIRYLRKKIDANQEIKLIRTVHGKGYRLGE
ncbi:MAG: response regulator transcription factor [Eubacteriales bacterium]|nr:response regulator transcription factor [Eubacteriales bacterium]